MTRIHSIGWVAAVNAASGVALAGLGVFVLSVSRRDRANAGFALFAVSLGLSLVILNVTHAADGAVWALAGAGFAALAVVGLAMLLRGLVPDLPTPAVPLVAACAAVSGVLGALDWGDPAWYENVQEGFGQYFAVGGVWGVLFVVAHAFPRVDATARRRLVITSLALVLYPAWFSGDGIPGVRWDWPVESRLNSLLHVSAVFAFALLWLRAGARAGTRSGRHLAWTALAMLTASMFDLPDDWVYGVARTAGVVLLAYGILRYQLLGLDLKVRWAISKSTIGALFIAAFFVASEVAQRYFEANVGPYLGIAAAGMLVFALAPLQRLADRVATAAVPFAAAGAIVAPAAMLDERAERVYRRAVRAAIDDGQLTRAEEEHLAHIAHELGIGHVDALRLRREEEAA